MRISDVLYFSPRFKFSDLNFDDKSKLIEAFRDRVENSYLAPASQLLKAHHVFASGLICCAAIEFIARISGKKDPVLWLQNNIADFGAEERLAARFWGCFRHGLAHEGRVKSFGQFSLELQKMLTSEGAALIVNPQLLLEAVGTAFRAKFNDAQTTLIAERLRHHFEGEVKAAKK